MLPPAARLRRRAEFAATTSRGGRRAARGALVVHLVTPTPSSPATGAPVRAGFTVSKAVGTAVVRNRVRRRLRHLVAERLDTLLAALPAGADLVVRALPAAAHRDYHELGRDLDQALAAATAPRKPRVGAR